MAGRLISSIMELNEFNIEFSPRKAIKAQVTAKVLAEFAESEDEK